MLINCLWDSVRGTRGLLFLFVFDRKVPFGPIVAVSSLNCTERRIGGLYWSNELLLCPSVVVVSRVMCHVVGTITPTNTPIHGSTVRVRRSPIDCCGRGREPAAVVPGEGC